MAVFAILALSLFQSAVLLAAYSKIDSALAPVVSLRSAINVLTDEIKSMANRVSLVGAVSDTAVGAVKSAVDSEAVHYVANSAERLYNRVRGRVPTEHDQDIK